MYAVVSGLHGDKPNDNGDYFNWEEELLRLRPDQIRVYATWIGKPNLLNHDAAKIVGKIEDTWPIKNEKSIDMLVATERKGNRWLVNGVEKGDITDLSMGCFKPGTQISLADGSRIPIEEVCPGDMVITHKGRAREVKNLQIREYSGEVKVIHATGMVSDVAATPNHGFFVYRPSTVCACGCGELINKNVKRNFTSKMKSFFKVGHHQNILNSNSVYSKEETDERRQKILQLKQLQLEKVRADELQRGDFLCFPRMKFNSGYGNYTVGKARLIGYFLAEGSYTKCCGERVAVEFNFSLNEKDTFVKEVVDLLKQEFPNGNKPWIQVRGKRHTCMVHLHGRDVAKWFFDHCGEYCYGKCMPKKVFHWPVELQKHLIGAWLNGDGMVHKIHHNVSGTTVSYKLATQLHLLMSRCGLHTRVECRVRNRAFEMKEVVNGDPILCEDGSLSRPSFTLTVGRANSKDLVSYFNKVQDEDLRERPSYRMNNEMVMFPIMDIRSEQYNGKVYNMEVEEDHSYVADGVTVENCSVEYSYCSECNHMATNELEWCEHLSPSKLNLKGKMNPRTGRFVYEDNRGVTGMEVSWITFGQGADPCAKKREILARKRLNWGNVADCLRNPLKLEL
jgi:hypothetical protein